MDEDVELVRAFLSEIKGGSAELAGDEVRSLDFLKARIDDPSGRISGNIEYSVNWIKSETEGDKSKVREGESLFQVMAVNGRGKTVDQETKVARKNGSILVLKNSGFVEKGENIAVLVSKSKKSDKSASSDEKKDTKNTKEEVSGAVYVLKNEKMPGILKIGYTEGDPRERAKKLSSSEYVPSRYKLSYYENFQNPEKEERRIHISLSEKRITPRKEFFRVSIDEAKEIINGKENYDNDGYVCVFNNSFIRDLILIDSTVKPPSKKAKIMSEQTGVPAPYKVAFSAPSKNHTKVELETKKELSLFKKYNKFYEMEVQKAKRTIEMNNKKY